MKLITRLLGAIFGGGVRTTPSDFARNDAYLSELRKINANVSGAPIVPVRQSVATIPNVTRRAHTNGASKDPVRRKWFTPYLITSNGRKIRIYP